MVHFFSFDLYEVTGGSYTKSFNEGRSLGNEVGEKAKESIGEFFNFLLSSIFPTSGGYNSSGYRGGIRQDGRSHSSGGRYLN